MCLANLLALAYATEHPKLKVLVKEILRDWKAAVARSISMSANMALLIPCMKMILRADQHHCRDVALLRLYMRIHTSIQQQI